HLLQGGFAWALVDQEVADRDDLVVEAAVLDGVAGAFVAAQGPALHVLAGDVPLLGDQLGAAELGDLVGAVAVVPALRADERRVEAVFLAREHGGRDRDGAHVLHAGRDDHLGGAAHDGLGAEVDGLLAGTALAVDGDAGDLFGVAGREPHGAADIAGLGADVV